MRNLLGMITALAACAALLLVGATCAGAASGGNWYIDSFSNTTAQPGSTFEYSVEVKNLAAKTSGGSPTRVTASLPQGFVVQTAVRKIPSLGEPATEACPIVGSTVECTVNEEREPGQFFEVLILVSVEPGLEGNRTAFFTVSGGGIGSAATVDPTRIRSVPPPFGVDAFDVGWFDGSGHPNTQAGSHPADFTTSFDFNAATDPILTGGLGTSIEPVRGTFAAFPPGFVGDPTEVGQCTARELAQGGNLFPAPRCPPDSQLGTVTIRHNALPLVFFPHTWGPTSVYNMVPPPGVAARFGFNVLNTVIVLDTTVRSDGDYGLTTGSRLIPQAFGLMGAKFDFWGVPSSPTHDAFRTCPGGNLAVKDPSCVNEDPETAFFRNPTSCSGPAASALRADSYTNPGDFKEASSTSHASPGYPYAPGEWGDPVGFEGCEELPFEPSLTGAPPSGAEAAEPTSFSFDLGMPQNGFREPDALSESDLRKAVVTLPEGVRLNPSSADGLGGCGPAQVGLTTPVGQADAHFTNDGGNCPESAKIGTVDIVTPLLDHPISGAVYQAQPQQNPFGSLLGLYLVVHDAASGFNLKLPAKVELDPNTGQITTTFDNNPQLPFESFHLEFKSGPRAVLSAPKACGTYTTRASLLGWSGKTVQSDSSFTISHGCRPEGFSPTLKAGTRNANAGSYSPLSVRLIRSDADQEFASLSVSSPEGVSAKLAGVPYCPEAAIAHASALTAIGQGALENSAPSCPRASQVGTITVGSGAGITPFFLRTGKIYLAGPYKGAPLSFFTETPVLAGPLDLGVVANRVALHVDPETLRITAESDRFPAVLFGIPLQMRDLRFELDRDQFSINPTDCEPTAISAVARSLQGQSANLSERFQVANCDRLGFKPKLALALKGGTRRGQNPALSATLTMPPGGANIAAASVALPHSEFLDQGHIGTVCTRVQYAAGPGGGAGCPAKSVYGHVRAFSPLLEEPLEGPVFLRSSSHELPDLVASLDGQIHVDVAGRIDSVHGGIRNTFEVVPDAPVSKFTLTMAGAKKGLLENSTNLCAATHRANAEFTGQNGKVLELRPALRAHCPGLEKGHRRR